MWSVHHDHSDLMWASFLYDTFFLVLIALVPSFWIIAIPLMAIVIPLFTFSDIRSGIHYVHKKMTAKEAVKVCFVFVVHVSAVALNGLWRSLQGRDKQISASTSS